MDKSWFSQLEAVEEDMTCKKIILKPATTFIGDWIKHKYGRYLLDAFSNYNFTFEFIQADKGARAM
ncbi:DnaA N-terminal domain-containing protein [Candidatus Tisiphia endosymbiont of Micropterix aruncella]|uniref:DnaA N-terminal domain-containing protein n=1 Tax=Candidatus Tisiphia endosymbiont of Micropterix aruncella TaxID=3066271 RepID=UPI003AA8297D